MADPQSANVRRRAVLQWIAALGAGPLASCSTIEAVCPDGPGVSFKGGPLTIDAHCHVFNGSDLQIREFLSRVAIRQSGALGEGVRILASLLQELGWELAPGGSEELAALARVAAEIRNCKQGERGSALATLRQDAYSTGRAQLQSALRRSPEFGALLERRGLPAASREVAAKLEAIRRIEALPKDVDRYQAERSSRLATLSLSDRSLAGMIDFVLQNFQYRYVSTQDYLRTYNQPGKRVVDLVLAMLVDYDWWLAKGQPTPTSIPTQVEVMKQIAIVTQGRVHAFVPFDPLRRVAYKLKRGQDDALQVAKDSVEQHGCIGVKLYPPMGFAPMGNAVLDGKRFWARDWLPTWTDRPDLGHLLDEAMGELFRWCESNEVPVMAHSNVSNGPLSEFEQLAGSDGWATALAAFPRLRVSFGHFGDTAPVADGLARARAFSGLMHARAGEPGTAAYADAGYFVEILDRRPELRDSLRILYEETAGKGDAALANRFMYGTDWDMTLAEGAVSGYLTDFVELLDGLEGRPAIRSRGITGLSGKFFGGNAADWLGLRPGGATRTRLDEFYKRNGVPNPDWEQKIG